MKKQNGFTLIEVLIYLALFGLVFSGLFISAFAVIGNIGRNDVQIMVQEEGDFLLAKIERGDNSDIFAATGGILQINGVSLNNSQTIVNDLKFDDTGNGAVIASFTLSAKLSGGQNYSQIFSTICPQ